MRGCRYFKTNDRSRMITYNGLPLYRVVLSNEQDGVLRVSLVDAPAVDSDFEVFQKEEAKRPALYAVQDEEKRLVRGVILRADYPIFRRDKAGDAGYYVTFGADVIREAAERYLAEGRSNEVNLQHVGGSDVDDVNMVQFFIKESAAGVDPEGFDDIADGSLFGEYHVTNDDVWEEIKAGTFKGFSVEILYTLIPAGDTMAAEDPEEAEIVTFLQDIFSHVTDMSKLEKIKARLASLLAEPERNQEPQKFGSVTTDKGVIYWPGDEDLKAGDRVEVEDAEGNRSAAADGEYVTGDGKTIVVVDGSVSEIRDPEAEVAPEGDDDQEETPEQMAAQRSAKFSESYDEKERKIVDAIMATLDRDVYGHLVDAGDDFAVFDSYGEFNSWGDTYHRYKVSWNEDGSASVSDPVEVRRAFVPVDFDDAALFAAEKPETVTAEEYEAAVQAAETFKAEVGTLKARIAELEKTPAGKSAAETFHDDGPQASASNGFKTGDKGLDKLARKIR